MFRLDGGEEKPQPLPMQSKVTRRKVEVDRQIAFLLDGKQVHLDAWPRKHKAQQEAYPLIIKK
jgi:hypothetical protein